MVTREFTVLECFPSYSAPYVLPSRSIQPADETGRVLIFLGILLAMVILTIPASATDTILFDPSSVAVEQGGTANITILLDEAPSGLAEFQFDVLLSNPSVVHITGVTFPSWVYIGKASTLPSASLRMSGVDLDSQIEPGDVGIVFGTISLEGGISGTSAISIKNIYLVEEGGELFTPSIRDGTISTGYGGIPITWAPETAAPSMPGTLATTTPNALSDGMNNSSDRENLGSGIETENGSLRGNPTPALAETEVTTIVVNPETSLTVETTVSTVVSEIETKSAASPVMPTTTGSAGIPWYGLVVGIMLVIISVYILYLAITKKI